MENENLQDQPIVQPPSLIPDPQKDDTGEGIIKFVIAAFCFLLGLINTASSLFLGIFFLPQVIKLESSLDGKELNQFLAYSIIFATFLLGCSMLLAGAKALKGKELNKILLFLVFSFFISAVFLGFMTASIITPIYKLTSNYQNSSAPLNQTPTPTIDPTANWKTYENKTYGYSLKYPPTGFVILKENADEIIIGAANIDHIKITYSNFENYKAYTDCKSIEDGSMIYGSYPCVDEADVIKLDKVDADNVYLFYGMNEDFRIIRPIENPKIQLKLRLAGGGIGEVFGQILSTFKFTDEQQEVSSDRYIIMLKGTLSESAKVIEDMTIKYGLTEVQALQSSNGFIAIIPSSKISEFKLDSRVNAVYEDEVVQVNPGM